MTDETKSNPAKRLHVLLRVLEANGFTMDEISERTRLHPDFLARHQRNPQPDVGAGELYSIHKGLEVDPLFFFGHGDDEQDAQDVVDRAVKPKLRPR
jgi:hypothetical protein